MRFFWGASSSGQSYTVGVQVIPVRAAYQYTAAWILITTGCPIPLIYLPTAFSARWHRPSALQLTPIRIAYSAVQPSRALLKPATNCDTALRIQITAPLIHALYIILRRPSEVCVARTKEPRVVVRHRGSESLISTVLRVRPYRVFGPLGPAYTARRMLYLVR